MIGGAALYVGWDYKMGTPFRMGPGYFPFVLCCILIGLGAIVALRGVVVGGDPPDSMQFRPIFFITLAVFSFAGLITTAGLLPAAVVIVLLGALGGPEYRTIEAIVLAVLLAGGAIALFKLGLGMSFPILANPLPF